MGTRWDPRIATNSGELSPDDCAEAGDNSSWSKGLGFNPSTGVFAPLTSPNKAWSEVNRPKLGRAAYNRSLSCLLEDGSWGTTSVAYEGDLISLVGE